jgi:hypothetical protein
LASLISFYFSRANAAAAFIGFPPFFFAFPPAGSFSVLSSATSPEAALAAASAASFSFFYFSFNFFF